MESNDDMNDIFKWQWDPRGKLSLVLPYKTKTKDDENKVPLDHNTEEQKWTLYDLVLASEVFDNKTPDYNNEAEMRRVLSLVYDVLRFQPILNQVLENDNFWIKYEYLKNKERIVLLLFYDMQVRKPVKLNKMSYGIERKEVLNRANILKIEEVLLKNKTSLSATMAKLRIHEQALTFDDLLPRHLRTKDKVFGTSGWVNTIKIPNQREFINEMSKLGFSICYECQINALNENLYNFDPLCPKVVNFHEKAREKLAVSDLVRKFYFIFLDRSLCFGAAALYHAIRVERFCGPVILTHTVAPRHVAYLSSLLSDIDHAGRLLVFGAGNKRKIYENYLNNLGMTLQQCQIFSESYVTTSPSPELNRVTAILATPSSSYSGINDVVDLAIAKGGDIEIFESLTTADILQEPKNIMEDQLTTLKFALQKPNIQFVIYEVHSILPYETTKITEEVVQYTNKNATEKYIKLYMNRRKKRKDKDLDKMQDADKAEDDVSITSDILVPNSDLFEIVNISDIYKDETVNNYINEGCFLTVIKRKEIMHFDSIFMIKFAESKGLFGNADKSADQRLSILKEPSKTRRKSKKQQCNWERISSHTHSSLIKKRKQADVCPKVCQRMNREKDIILTQVLETTKKDAKRWWIESKDYLMSSPQVEISQFRILHTDPITNKFLCPLNILKPVVNKQNNTISAFIS